MLWDVVPFIVFLCTSVRDGREQTPDGFGMLEVGGWSAKTAISVERSSMNNAWISGAELILLYFSLFVFSGGRRMPDAGR